MQLFKYGVLGSVRPDTKYVRDCPYYVLRTQVIKVGNLLRVPNLHTH